MNLEDFENTFVFTNRRAEIFKNYLEFVDILKGLPIGNFFQWLDGSFVTKKPFPNDLDLVTFVDANAFMRFENRLRVLETDCRWNRLDAYSVPVYPETTFKHYITRYAMEEKQELFGSDRLGQPKGFIQINF
jgi:hypothetical protein